MLLREQESGLLSLRKLLVDLKLPDYMSKITMLVQTTGSTMDEIIESGVKMLGCALGSLASSVVVAIFAARVATNFAANLRERLFDKYKLFQWKKLVVSQQQV